MLFSFRSKENTSIEKIDLGEYCLQFSTFENLLDELNEDHLILNLQLLLKIAKAVFLRILNQTYDKNSVQNGEFEFGESLEIKNLHNFDVN